MAKDIVLGKIKGKKIVVGPNREPVLIAEVGVLTWGELQRGFRFVDEAKKAGITLIKFQAFRTDHVVSPSDEFWFNRLKQRELSKENFFKIKRYAEKQGLLAFATTHNEYDLVDFAKLGMPILKIGSGDSNNFRMIDMALKTGKPVIVSLGLMDKKEAEAVLSRYRRHADRIIFMHCITLYPTPPEAVDLTILADWRKRYPEYNIGYSDHTLGLPVALAATALGAPIIEKHLCLPEDRIKPKYESYDINVALIPSEMKALKDGMREIFMSLQKPPAAIQKILKKNSPWARKSIVARVPITAGSIISPDKLVSRRPYLPNKGHISIEHFAKVAGAKATRDINAGAFITLRDFGKRRKS